MLLENSVIEAFAAFGLTPNAELADVAKAYKKLALEHHPDRNHGDSTATERFQKVRHTLLKTDGIFVLICKPSRSARHGVFAKTIIEIQDQAFLQHMLLVRRS
jgi:hypothetical protein